MDYRLFTTDAQLQVLNDRLRNYEAQHFVKSLEAKEFSLLDDPEFETKAEEAQRAADHFAKLIVSTQAEIDARTTDAPPAD